MQLLIRKYLSIANFFFTNKAVLLILICSIYSIAQFQTVQLEGRVDSVLLINFPLNEVVVTGEINQKSVSESLNTYIVISNKDIQSSVSTNLADLLTNQALFDIDFDPAIGSKNLKIQGMSGNNVNILIDGIPVIGRKDSQIDLSQINLSNIERIEILKGPASVQYGTNSTGGVINLISKKNQSNGINVENYFETIGVTKISINADQKINNYNMHINLGTYHFPGLGDAELREQDWRYKDQNFGDILFTRNIKKINFTFKKSMFFEKIIDYGPEQFFPNSGTAIDQHYKTLRDNNVFKFSYKNDSFDGSFISSYSKTKFINDQYTVNIATGEDSITDNLDYNTKDTFQSFYNRLQINYIDWKNLKIQIGLDAIFDYVSGSKVSDTVIAQTQSLAFFSQLNWDISKRVQSQLGFRVPYHSLYKAPLIPSLQFKFNIASKTQFRLSYARGFRAPTIRELYMDFVDSQHNIFGNSNLKAETSHSFQSSINYIIGSNSNYYSSFNVEGFINSLKSKIDLAPMIDNANWWSYYNLDDITYYGLNTTLTTRFNVNKDIFSDISIMWSMFRNNDSAFNYKNPEHNLSVNYFYEYNPCNCGFKTTWKWKSKHDFYRVGEMSDLIVDTQEGYQLLNFNLFKNFPKINSSIYLGIKNLFDTTDIKNVKQEDVHSGPFSTISWGRSYFIKLNWKPF